MLMQQAQQQPQVEAPLFGSLFRRKTPTFHEPVVRPRPSTHTPIEEPTMHPLEKLRLGTEIISGLGVTGAQLYQNI